MTLAFGRNGHDDVIVWAWTSQVFIAFKYALGCHVQHRHVPVNVAEGPPRLLPGPTAQQLMSRAQRYGLVTAPIILAMGVGPLLPTPIHQIQVLTVATAGIVCAVRATHAAVTAYSVIRSERRAGYTTLSSFASPRLWLLDWRSGEVLRRPTE
jgi:hypothetical protein